MPRRPRVSLPGVTHHIIQRGNNRIACFYSENDYRFYLEWLFDYAEHCQYQVHAYVLMTNHVHLFVTPETRSGLGELMKRLGQRYVQYINRTYQRTGTLWEGRFKSCITQDDQYVLSCYRYIELNPVRANIVSHPAEYAWSSYRSNAQGECVQALRPHVLYLALGNTAEARQSAYRELFRYHLEPDIIDDIRQSTNGNYALGSERFKKQIEDILGRRVRPGVNGRPKRNQ